MSRLIGLLLTAAVVFPQFLYAAAACEDVDLRKLWQDDGRRNQRDIGSCHIFATVAMLEAEIYRKTGEHVILSEADLFTQHMLAQNLQKLYGDDIFRPGEIRNDWTNPNLCKPYVDARGTNQDEELGEGGNFLNDFSLAKKNGIAAASEDDSDFISEFKQLRTQRLKARERIADQFNREDLFHSALTAFKENSSLQNGIENLQKQYDGRTPRESAFESRKRYLSLIQSFSPTQLKIDYASGKEILTPVATSRIKAMWNKVTGVHSPAPRDQRDIILSVLRSGRPLAASIIWVNPQNRATYATGSDGKPIDGSHAIVIAGYNCKRNTYLIRNSWGGADRRPDGYDEIPVDSKMIAFENVSFFGTK